MENFYNLGISKEILSNLKFLKLLMPTPVQQKAIQPGFKGKDILAIANTGTGKTAAFGIPIIERLNNNKSLSAIILTPTRELAVQVGKHLTDLMGKNIRIKSAVLIGGDSIKKQIKLIKQNPRIFIGTPGRINDHITRKTLNLKNINILVLDETDRMLDLGFIKQIESIINILPKAKQTLLFTATLPNNIKSISEKYLNNPVKISVETKENILRNIEHNILNIKQADKYERLLEELHTREGSILVFMKTKHSSKRIYLKLQKDGVSVNAIHGNVRQNKRLNILNKFRNQKFTVLVATDIAARGLDIPHIEHVINYDLPQRTEDYIHRIGRTARAGKKGSALSFISESEKNIWKDICKLITPNDQKIENSKDLKRKSLKSSKKDLINYRKKNKNSRNFKTDFFKSKNKGSKKNIENNNSKKTKSSFFKPKKVENNDSQNVKVSFFKSKNKASRKKKLENNDFKSSKGSFFEPKSKNSKIKEKKNSQNIKGSFFKSKSKDATIRKKKKNNSTNVKGKFFKSRSKHK
jgi:superfamily II DNA/RNA helicase